MPPSAFCPALPGDVIPERFRRPGEAARALLLRPARTDAPVSPASWRDAPLRADVAALTRPGTPLDPEFLAALLLKWLHAVVHPGSEDVSLSLAEVTLACDRFVNRRRGAASLEGQDRLRRRLLRLGFALTMLADLQKTVAILRTVAGTPLPPGEGFLGLDIGSGTGVLMLGMYLCAGRNGRAAPKIVGLERDPHVAEAAGRLTASLGIGRIARADAKSPAAYDVCNGGVPDFVCNETIPSMDARLWKEDFLAINQVLFERLGEGLAQARFFPEAVVAADPRTRASVLLAPENRFAPETVPPLRLLHAAGIVLEGRAVTLDRVGEEFTGLVTPAWRELLGRRW